MGRGNGEWKDYREDDTEVAELWKDANIQNTKRQSNPSVYCRDVARKTFRVGDISGGSFH